MLQKKENAPLILIYGEGSDDADFAKHIKSIYGKGQKATIDNGNGGSPVNVLKDMRNHVVFEVADRRYILVDSDREQDLNNMLEKIQAESLNVIPIIAEQCLEHEILKILKASKGILARTRCNSQTAKKELAKICDMSKTSYNRLLSKPVLDEARKTNNWLDSIIKIYEFEAEPSVTPR